MARTSNSGSSPLLLAGLVLLACCCSCGLGGLLLYRYNQYRHAPTPPPGYKLTGFTLPPAAPGPGPATRRPASPATAAPPKKSVPAGVKGTVVKGAGAPPGPGADKCPPWAAPNATAGLQQGFVPYGPVADQLATAAKSKPLNVAFLGDSITYMLDANLAGDARPFFDALKGGAAGVGVFGIGGDTVEGLMWRLCNGGMPDARVYVVCIGTNNAARPTPEVVGRALYLLAYLRARKPQSHVLDLSLMWRGDGLQAQADAISAGVLAGVRKMDPKTHGADWGRQLTQPDFLDNVHPSGAGWAKVLGSLVPYVNTLL